MTRLRRLLAAVIVAELAAAIIVVGLRLSATLPRPPRVTLDHDALTAAELLALPDRFLFDSSDKWRQLGEAYLAYGYFRKAEACLVRAVRAAPHDAEIAFTHGFCLERQGKITEAETAFRRAAETVDTELSRTCWYHIGRNHLRLEQPQAAARAFEKAGDRHLPSVFQRAKLLVRHGRTGETESLLQRLAESHPRDLHVWQLRARAEQALGHRQAAAEARDELERATVSLALNDMEAYLNPIRQRFGLAREIAKTREQWNAGAAEFAADSMTRLLDDDGTWENSFPLLLQEAAAGQLAAGNRAMATVLVRRQFDDQGLPTAIAWELRGDIELADGHLDQAFAAWNHADRMQPSAGVHRKLARLAEQRQNGAPDRRHLALAGQLIGMEYFRQNRLERARSIFAEAVAFAADQPHLWFYRGETERFLGDQAAAEAAYRQCLQLDPCHGRALSALERLTGSPP